MKEQTYKEEQIAMEEHTDERVFADEHTFADEQPVTDDLDKQLVAEEPEVLRQLNRIFTRIEIAIYLVSILIVFGTIGYLGVKTAGTLLSRVT
jgi:hypothetical protein